MLGLIASVIFSGTFITLLLHYVFHFAVPNAVFWSCVAMAGAVVLNHLTNLTARMLVFWAGSYNDPAKEARVREIMAKHIPAYLIPCDLEVRIVKDDTENAYALGKNIMGVNTGLLTRASEEEIAGIIGHELGHLHYGDSVLAAAAFAASVPGIMAMALLGFLVALAFAMLLAFFSRDEGGSTAIFAVVGAAGFLLYLAVVLAFYKSSRNCEYRADAFSARINDATRRGLIAWLERNEGAPRGRSVSAALFSTHPAPKDRVARLKEMMV